MRRYSLPRKTIPITTATTTTRVSTSFRIIWAAWADGLKSEDFDGGGFGAVFSGLVDLTSSYGQLARSGLAATVGWAESGQGRMGGDPWTFRDRYIENSPFDFLNRVAAPVLVIHGVEDQAVPTNQADELYVGLRRLGKEVEYRRYEGEGHVIAGLSNLEDYWSAMIRWFGRHLGRG